MRSISYPTLSTLALGLLSFTSALPTITRTGKYLYDPQGQRFSIKGVAYQPQGQLAENTQQNQEQGGFPEPSSYIDPLSSSANCTRDLPYLQQLGVNAVRVYSVNSSLNHDDCMDMFDKAGIYVLLDLSLPLNGSINRAEPSWTTNLLDAYINTINAFDKYDNILGYTIGNEVVNLASNTDAAPYVKAAARDIKAYLRGINSTALVSYAAVDGDAAFRNSVAEYMTCGDESVQVDLYGLNNYEWCGNENLNSSHWNSITSGFSDIPVPTYMSEYGCITSPPRLWTEVQALFAPPVSNVFSGGMAFSYFPTSDGYGMVTFSSDGTQVDTTSDFERLAKQYGNVTLPTSPTQSNSQSSTLQCPAENSTLEASSDLPPTPDASVCNCLNQNAFSCRIIQSSANQPAIVGELTNYACSLLGSSGAQASCNAIAGNGTSGTYGELSFCSPAIKLSYAMSAYYMFNPVSTSCDFGGNATLSPNAPNTPQDASSAAESCLAAEPSGGVFTPSATTSSVQNTGTSSSSPSPSRSGSAGLRVKLGGGGMESWFVGIAGAILGGTYLLI
ncbi:putative 1,3-beta-glucanosyltransferase [Kockovaella imperatae]|uniref:1,3-beta-glucanosyltransferase n=1 Tax=Kockovaella imperatae TaxID=4999 RepID=A0A1Y1UNC7_9TREE|nr:putative 1,3-beta-glucanosyltransferase [Kockovaella imperatae]ORX38966.1 putative 1,3-beta-glucanosyltransferase [Kockovaella imperatae]